MIFEQIFIYTLIFCFSITRILFCSDFRSKSFIYKVFRGQIMEYEVNDTLLKI